MGFIRNVAVIVEPIDFKKFRENLQRSVCHLSAQFSDSANDRSEEKTLIQFNCAKQVVFEFTSLVFARAM